MPQRVLVTAGANGIGLAIARAFAKEGARLSTAAPFRFNGKMVNSYLSWQRVG